MKLETLITYQKNDIKRKKAYLRKLVGEGRLPEEVAELEIAKSEAVYRVLTQVKGLQG